MNTEEHQAEDGMLLNTLRESVDFRAGACQDIDIEVTTNTNSPSAAQPSHKATEVLPGNIAEYVCR